MGPKRTRGQRHTPYDPELLENWTINRLRDELNNRNIRPPQKARRMSLVRLLRNSRSVDDVSNGHDSMDDFHDTSVASARSHNAPQNVNNGDRTTTLIDLVSKLSSNVQNLQQNVISLNNKFNSLSNSNSVTNNVNASRNDNSLPSQSVFTTTSATISPSSSTQSFTIESALQNLQSSPMIRRNLPTAAAGSESQAREITERNTRGYVRTTYGYAAESLPLVETISPQLRQNIAAGRDVNLATLLIPYYTGPCSDKIEENQNQNKPDPRLNRSLSIGEFIQAFSIFKSVMCSAYPQRRNELDLYERDIVDMATRYSGRGFYEYHRQFSLQAASHLRYNNIMVDWSVRNNSLFCNIFANLRPNTCNHCNSTLHLSGFCPSNVQKATVGVYNIQGYKGNKSEFVKDSYGRSRVYHLGKEICNNYNGDRGCKAFRCNNFHVCIICKKDHSQRDCPLSKN